jgi:hypothetical protein
MGCGSWCAYYKDRNKSVAMCRYCPDYDKDSAKPRQGSGNLGIRKLAYGLDKKIKNGPVHDKPPTSESRNLRLIVDNGHADCPIKKDDGFPCPKCAYSISTSERKAFLNTTTWWYCAYPNVANFSMLQEKEMTALLKLEYRNQGYTLSKDENFVYLKRNGKNCKVFSSLIVSIAAVEKHIESSCSV